MKCALAFENGRPRRAAPTELTLLVLILLISGCKSQSEPTTTDNAANEPIVSHTPPFKTKEPDRYRGTRITTTQTANGESRVTKSFITKDGEMRRYESGSGIYQSVQLDLPEARFILLVGHKVYVDLTVMPEISPIPEDVTAEWMVSPDAGPTTYQRLGMEAVGGRKADKYRIVVNVPTSGSVIVNETLLWVDQEWQMPIRSEIRGSDGIMITTELTDVALDVDKSVFQVPNDYRKITYTEFLDRLRQH